MTHWRCWVLVGALCVSPSARAAIETFLCIANPAILGGVVDPHFPGCVRTLSQVETALLDGSAVIARELRFTKALDDASLPLQAAMVAGTVLGTATFNTRRAGGVPQESHWIIKLFNARVTSVSVEFDVDGSLREAVSLRPARVEYTYYRVRVDGTRIQPPQILCWDVAAGTSTSSTCP